MPSRPSISGAIARAERGLGTPSVVVVDLDGFKAVNDKLGHAAGDAVLRSVAQRLRSTARERRHGRPASAATSSSCCSSTPAAPAPPRPLSRLRRGLDGAGPRSTGGVEVSAPRWASRPTGPATAWPRLLARADAEMYADKARRAALSLGPLPQPWLALGLTECQVLA